MCDKLLGCYNKIRVRLSSKQCIDLGYLIVAWTIGTYKETCQLNEFVVGLIEDKGMLHWFQMLNRKLN